MRGRSQSDVIGVVLLTLVVTVTVTASGGVVLTEWQSDIGSDDPLADIESTYKSDELVLEHTGGDAVAASEVSVQIGSSGDQLSLTEFENVENEFAGGMRIEKDDLPNRVGFATIRVIHEPSDTVLHSERHYLGFLFLIGGESGPAFMTDSSPVNYTAPGNAVVTASNSSVVDVDESDNNISALTSSGSTTITADDRTDRKSIDLTVVEPDQLGVDTLDATTVGGNIEVDGELTTLGELDSTDLYVQYRKQRPIEFNEDPDDDGDNVIADGQFFTGPDGYAHGDGYVHDYGKLVPGVNRTYEYRSTSETFNLAGRLRDEDDNWLTGFEYTPDFPKGSRFNATVEYTDDGSTVNVHIEGSPDTFSWDVSEHDAVYYSSYEGLGTTGPDSLRLISLTGPGEPQYDRIRRGVERPTNYTGELSGLRPDTYYYVAAHAQRNITNAVINTTGMELGRKTGGLVEANDPENVTAESATLRGELLYSYGEADVTFVLTRADGTVVTETEVATDLAEPQAVEATVEGLSPDTEYTYYLRVEDSGIDGDTATDTSGNASFTTQQPVINTLTATTTGADSIEVDGELVDLGGLDEMDLYIRYWEYGPVEFNEDPDDDGDYVTADGQFFTGPDGYAHGDGYVHDHSPLVPGMNRTYEYRSTSETYNLAGKLRDADDNWLTGFEYTSDYPKGSRFNVTVEYTDDGSTVNAYIEGSPDTFTWDASSYDEVYYSSYAGLGTTGPDSLRLISVPGPTDPQFKLVDSNVSTEQPYTGELTGLQSDTYYFETYAEEEVGDQLINASGSKLAGYAEP